MSDNGRRDEEDESTDDSPVYDRTAGDEGSTTDDTTVGHDSTTTATDRTPAQTNRSTPGRDRRPGDGGTWISAIVGVAGLWLIAQAFLFATAGANFWNDLVIGAGLAVLGGFNLYRRMTDAAASSAAAALTALFGLWLVIAPYVYDAGFTIASVATDLAYWNNVTVGVIAIVLGTYSFLRARRSDRAATTG